jgi:hypothetical protein
MPETFPHGYALLVGVGATPDYPAWSLPVTVKDVKAIRAILTNPNLCGYLDDHIRLLHDQTATRAEILAGLAWLKERVAADPNATALVYYAGHGWLEKDSGRYFLIQNDVIPFNIPGSALAAEEFTAALREVQARRLLVALDCCHAQGMATSRVLSGTPKLPPGLAQTAPTEGLIGALKQGEGRAVITSSRGSQLSWERSDGSLGVFTHHLIEAFQGAGNKPRDKVVRLSNLMNHLSQAVPASVKQMCAGEQVPFFDTATEDFPVALLQGGKGLDEDGWGGVMRKAEDVTRQVVTNIIASGERAVAVGTMFGGAIITGDQSGTGHSVGRKGQRSDRK